MAIQIVGIPKAARTSGSARFRANLDGATFVLTIQFNQREGRWTLDVADVNEVAIVSGLAMVCDWPLMRLVTDARRPLGELVVFRADGSQDPPALDELGDTVQLLYYEATA